MLCFCAEQASIFANYSVNSGWKATNAGSLRKGANSWNWIAKVTFTVPGPDPAVLIASDMNFVSEVVAIFDETGTTVSGSSPDTLSVGFVPCVAHLEQRDRCPLHLMVCSLLA